MSEKLLIDAEIAPAHVADEAVGFESALLSDQRSSVVGMCLCRIEGQKTVIIFKR